MTSISPNGGAPAGGTAVTIKGANFTGATAVKFGAVAAASFTVSSATSITTTSPAGAVGAVDVTVTSSQGTSATGPGDKFTYSVPKAVQQGNKLVGSGFSGASGEGNAVALSSDGNTAVVGGYNDSTGTGAVWVFSRSGSTWTQQGSKLVGSGNVSPTNEGYSVALSADGTTLMLGGPADNGGAGAVWVFTRSGSTWTQQGLKLTGGGESGFGAFGFAVALSSNGNVAIVGGAGDNGNAGAAWVFTRSGSTWTQQGSKLVGSGAAGNASQGSSVALNGAGTTALIGGFGDNDNVGAAWVFASVFGQGGFVWSQQGSKLAGSDATGPAEQGWSVALSSSGNTALVGGYGDNSGAGAAWVFTQNGGVWSQAGAKLTGTGAVGAVQQGSAVALSADGNTAAIGGFQDNALKGAVWLFTQGNGTWSQKGSKLTGVGNFGAAEQGISVALSGNTLVEGGSFDNASIGAAWVFALDTIADSHDFNADGTSDILWRDTAGDTTIWLMKNGNVSSGTGLGNVPPAWSVVGARDFNGDGNADILWRDTSGDTTIWLMSGGSIVQGTSLGNIPTAWSVAGTGDFNGDGKGDILWHDTGGDTTIWFMNGGTITSSTGLGTVPTIWSVAGVGDFNADGTSDILWHDIYGDVSVWLMQNGSIQQGVSLGNIPPNWSIVGTGDFNGDGISDVLWRDTAGDVMIWLIGSNLTVSQSVLGNLSTVWSLAETGDFNGDGKSDILWIDASGNVMVWYMNGFIVTATGSLGNVGTVWSAQGASAD